MIMYWRISQGRDTPAAAAATTTSTSTSITTAAAVWRRAAPPRRRGPQLVFAPCWLDQYWSWPNPAPRFDQF